MWDTVATTNGILRNQLNEPIEVNINVFRKDDYHYELNILSDDFENGKVQDQIMFDLAEHGLLSIELNPVQAKILAGAFQTLTGNKTMYCLTEEVINSKLKQIKEEILSLKERAPFTGDFNLKIRFQDKDWEPVKEYDPNNWNNFPEVTPPKDIWMRVEGLKEDFGCKARWDGEHWRSGLHQYSSDSIVTDVVCFRPWE